MPTHLPCLPQSRARVGKGFLYDIKAPEFSAPNAKSFSAERFFVWRRMILRAAANSFMPYATSATHTMRLNEKGFTSFILSVVQFVTVNFLTHSLHLPFTEKQASPHECPRAIERSEPDMNLYIEKSSFSPKGHPLPLPLQIRRQGTVRHSPIKKLRFHLPLRSPFTIFAHKIINLGQLWKH